MHTFIDLPREHTCALTYTSTLRLIQHMCMCMCTALYKSSHFYAAPRICCRNKACQGGDVIKNHKLLFLGWYRYQYSSSIDFSAVLNVCATADGWGRRTSYLNALQSYIESSTGLTSEKFFLSVNLLIFYHVSYSHNGRHIQIAATINKHICSWLRSRAATHDSFPCQLFWWWLLSYMWIRSRLMSSKLQCFLSISSQPMDICFIIIWNRETQLSIYLLITFLTN